MTSELNHEPPDEGGAFSGTDSSTSYSLGFAGPVSRPYVPHRGPVLISSDEESEPRPARPQVLRPLSKTPSWVGSGISPSPPQDICHPIGFSSPGSNADSESSSEIGGQKRKKKSNFPKSKSSTEHTGSRTSSSTRPIARGSIASRGSSRWGSVLGSDSECESNSGESGRIRFTRIESESNWSRRVLSPPGSDWMSSFGDSGDKLGSEETSPRPDLLFTDHGSISPREISGRKRHSKSRSSSCQYAESGSSVPPASHLAPKALGSPSESDNGKASDSGPDSEVSKSAAFDVDLDLRVSSSGADTATQVKKFGSGESPKTKKQSHKAKKRIHKLNPDYIRLLNEDIGLVASRGCEGNLVGGAKARRLRSRAIMGSIWTRCEETTFFKFLSIVGKDNLPELARGVGTKSIVECRAYLKALQDGKEDDFEFFHAQNHRGRDLFSAEDTPAAVELSDECVKALELDADYLECQTRRREESMEKAKWGDSWLLDSTTAEHIEHLYRNKCIEEIRDIVPEAELLNLDTMLDISGRVFMYGPEENNWTHWGEDPPSIRRTAFSDIHTLVVSLTRRLVQTALFMAMSRLRSMDGKIFRPQSLVRPSDVAAAIDCLGAPRKARYWVTLPRRLGLKVYRHAEQIRVKTEKNVMPYEEVEDYLEHVDERKATIGSVGNEGLEVNMDSLILSAYEASEPEGKADDESSSLDDSMEIDDGDLSSVAEVEDDYQFVGGTGRNKFHGKRDAKMAALECEEDALLEALDRKHSMEAERALWQMMEKEPKESLLNAVKFPKAPIHGRKRACEVLDWRDSVDYLAPWETIKRRKAAHGEAEGEGEEEEEEEEETDSRPVAKRVPTTSLEENIALQKKNAIPWKKSVVGKSLVFVPASPRELRVRRQSKVFSGYVSTLENVAESDAEALAREQDDNSSSDEEHGDG